MLRLRKIWSGLDFWDKDENKKQRQEFQRQDIQKQVSEGRAAAQLQAQGISRPQNGRGRGFSGLANDVRDKFDANTDLDRYKRMIEKTQLPMPMQKGPLDETYEQQQISRGAISAPNNVGERAADMIVGTTLRLANTGGAGLRAMPSLVKAGVGAATGNKVAEQNAAREGNRILKERLDGRGIAGTGGGVVDYDELGNMSAGDMTKRITATGIAGATELLPMTKGYNTAVSGSKALAKNATGDFITGGVGDAAYQMIETGKIDPAQVLTSAVTSTAMGTASYGAGKARNFIKENPVADQVGGVLGDVPTRMRSPDGNSSAALSTEKLVAGGKTYDAIKIDAINSTKARTGSATKLLGSIKELADNDGRIVILEDVATPASAYEGVPNKPESPMSQAALTKWYEKNGFKRLPLADGTPSTTMYYKGKPKPVAQAKAPKPTVKERKLVVDTDWNTLQQQKNLRKVELLLEQRKRLPPDSPQMVENKKAFESALREQEELLKQADQNSEIQLKKSRAKDRPKVTAKQVDPDVAEVQTAIKQAQAEGRIDEANQLNESLPPEARVAAQPVDNSPVVEAPKAEQTRALQEAIPGKSQADEAVINQELMDIENSKPRTQEAIFTDKALMVEDITNAVVERVDQGDISGAKSAADRLYEDPEYGASTARGQALLERGKKLEAFIKKNENAIPQDSTPVVETPVEAEFAGVGADGRRYDVNGEVMDAPVEAPKAETLGQFMDQLPDPKQTTRADADIIIGQGTDWLRKAGAHVEQVLAKQGDTYENFSRAIHKASDDSKAGITPELSPQYQALYDSIKPLLDRLRKESGVETGETPYYLPRRTVGGEEIQMGNTLVDALDAEIFGSQYTRTGALGIDDIDHTPEALGSYATQTLSEKYRRAMAADDLVRAAEERGAPITPEQAHDALDIQDQLVSDFTDAAKKGKEATHDTVSELNKLGKAEGIEPTPNHFVARLMDQSPQHMMEKAGVWENGFKQYDQAYGNGNIFIEMITEKKVPDAQFGDALRQSIMNQMPGASEDIVNRTIASTIRIMDRKEIAPKNANELVIRAFRTVAKDEMLKLGKTTKFTDTKMSKVISEQINDRVLKDIHRNNLAQGVDNFLTERINVSLRGGNIVSAAFETGDFFNIVSNYGIKDLKNTKIGLGKINGDPLFYSHKYGQGNVQFAASDMPTVQGFEKIWSDPSASMVSKVWQSYRSTENKLLLFRYVEQHKTEMFFRTAEKFYKDKGYEGSKLVDAVMDDFNKTMLPHNIATANRIVGKFPKVVTQYMNWGLQATKRLGRTLSGTNTSGKFKDMTRGGRIAYGAASELLPKVAVAALLGVPLMQILGMRDFTGATSGDFTGIEEDEKTFLDEVVTALSISPAMGVGGKFYFANRRNQEADQLAAKGEEYGAERRAEDKPLAVAQDTAMMVVPFRTQFKKTRDMAESVDRGSFENRDGRVQSETPTNGAEILTGLIAGKNYTQKMREYMDNPNAVTVLKGKAKPQDLLTHNETVSNVAQAIKLKNPRDYHRPLSASIKNKDGTIAVKGYSDMAKDAHAAAVKKHGVNSKQAREVLSEWTANGREYNRVTDDLKKKDPAAYETWIKAKDDDVLTPEKWRIYNGNRNVFAFEKKRKALEKRDLGRAIDPIYELPDNHANEILQERSSYTGEDMKLRALLWKKDWYADKFKVAEAKYFESFDGKRDDSSKGARVQEWNKLSEAAFSPKTGVITKYPLVAQYEAEVDKFDNYNSQERKDFTKSWYNNHGEAYTKQKEDYDNERFNLVNKMRKIENVGELTFDDFKAKVEFPSETAEKNSWAKGSKGGRGGGGGGGGGSKSFDPNKYRISLSTGKMDVSGKVNAAPVRAKVKRRVIAKPKVSMKKSAV